MAPMTVQFSHNAKYLQPESGLAKVKRGLRRRLKRLQRRLRAWKILPASATVGYWTDRASFHYYSVVEDWIEEQDAGQWIIDVGSRSTPMSLKGSFERRTMIDIEPFPQAFEGVEQVNADWMRFPIEQKADLVLCLQVLEHLDDELVEPFAKRVIAAGKRSIISVPYRWKETACATHLQDPVDFDKFIGWTGQMPVKYYIESRDVDQRLIAMFEST